MKSINGNHHRPWLSAILLLLLPILYLELVWLVMGQQFNFWKTLQNLGLILGAILVAGYTRPVLEEGRKWHWSWRNGFLPIAGVIFLVLAWFYPTTLFAYLGIGCIAALALCYAPQLAVGHHWIIQILILGWLACLVGGIPVAFAQLAGRFSDEEFFAALQGILIAPWWLILWFIWKIRWQAIFPSSHKGYHLSSRWLIGTMLAVTLGGIVWVLSAYPRSFYPTVAPAFVGISEDNPFLCGNTLPAVETYDGEQTFNRIISLVRANPDKQTYDYGMLSLVDQDVNWRQAFRQKLLADASQKLYTAPANSVKYGQYEAALRAYYYILIARAYPNLFSPQEQQQIKDWFAAINRRALTVEWVDWLYAAALGQWPIGPYENQENGAGLLALLEVGNLSDPALSARNQAYLDRQPRGWSARFRNSDDAFFYQLGWIQNSLFQSLYTGQLPADQIRRSFEWLLVQALPDGGRLRYNHVGTVTLAEVAYLGASMTKDNDYLWLSGRSLDYLDSTGGFLGAQPGLNQPVIGTAESPQIGSCLVYSNTGLPNQVGPLSPDKIIFRDGWEKDDAYLSLNLRFTGWHRYKATNDIILFYLGQPLVEDQLDQPGFNLLPVGRSQFRDKRIPRQLLNGFLIEQRGWSAVVYNLTGFGDSWAQDPPFLANVETFVTSDEVDHSITTLKDWHGWNHRREIYFVHDGPIVVIDEADGTAGPQTAIAWHVHGQPSTPGDRLHLGSADAASSAKTIGVEMVLLPMEEEGITQTPIKLDGHSGVQLLVQAPHGSAHLGVATIFLYGEWQGAECKLIEKDGHKIVRIIQDDQTLDFPIMDTTP